MVVLDVQLDNFYAFKNFHMNLTYPKKIVSSSIDQEHLADRPNFRYKKVNIIMGGNASGKTTFGHMLMNIFNFIEKKNYELLADAVCDRRQTAFFAHFIWLELCVCYSAGRFENRKSIDYF